jgi:hypothetical protein
MEKIWRLNLITNCKEVGKREQFLVDHDIHYYEIK